MYVITMESRDIHVLNSIEAIYTKYHVCNNVYTFVNPELNYLQN